MFIQSIKARNYGPFSAPATLHLEPDVTVLTGPNDVGKSSVLRLIGRICKLNGQAAADESEFNHDSLFDSKSDWEFREDFGAQVEVRLCEPLPAGFDQNLFRNHSHAQATVSLAPNKVIRQVDRVHNGGLGSSTEARAPFPDSVTAVMLPPDDHVRDVVELSTSNTLEMKLLRRAFGPGFRANTLSHLSGIGYLRALEQAEQQLNRLVESVLPRALGLAWKIRGQDDRNSLGFMLRDKHGGMTPLGNRGTGVRKVMSVLAHLMDHDIETGHTMVLFDEPETSLHADSQHLLRRLLEGLGAKPTVQVVYATHSPSMINVMRPESVRLLRRDTESGKATTRVDNRPFKDNYYPVRASLGLTPADSLLYAPVTVIVEGDTEVVGLPLLLLKLSEQDVPGFDDANLLLSQAHLLDGMGDRFGFVCQLAKSQGAKPIIFLDGDKKRHLAQHKLPETHPEVPIVVLDDGKEFEQLVPTSVYIQALADIVGNQGDQVTEAGYREWEKDAKLPERILFTKRIDRWLDDLGIDGPSKPQVMRKAIGLVTAEQVSSEPLRRLLAEIKRLLAS